MFIPIQTLITIIHVIPTVSIYMQLSIAAYNINEPCYLVIICAYIFWPYYGSLVEAINRLL